MVEPSHNRRAPAWLIVAAFAAIYIIWGSTYLAIRWAIASFPPFFMAGTRFLIAGSLLTAWLMLRGERLPTRRQWAHALVVATLMLGLGNGVVTWSEQYVPSGLVALFSALVPMWMVALNMLIPGPDGVRAGRPPAMVIAGLVIGSAGMVLLIRGRDGDFSGLGVGLMPKLAALALFFTTLAWALGSLLSRRMDRPASTFMSTAAQMLMGGFVLAAAAAARGEFADVSLSRLTWAAALSHAYLVVFGSIVALTTYTWLLRVVSPTRVATYGYVNPVVAVGFGWALGGEPLDEVTAIATAMIVASVALIVSARPGKSAVRANAPTAGGLEHARAAAATISQPGQLPHTPCSGGRPPASMKGETDARKVDRAHISDRPAGWETPMSDRAASRSPDPH